MALDKFGIEIQEGDLLAFVNTYRDNPCVLCVATGGFTNHFTRVSLMYLYGYEVKFKLVDKLKSKHLVVINEIQAEGIIQQIVQTRFRYQEGFLEREGFIQQTEEEIRTEIEKLLETSRNLKINRLG